MEILDIFVVSFAILVIPLLLIYQFEMICTVT